MLVNSNRLQVRMCFENPICQHQFEEAKLRIQNNNNSKEISNKNKKQSNNRPNQIHKKRKPKHKYKIIHNKTVLLNKQLFNIIYRKILQLFSSNKLFRIVLRKANQVTRKNSAY